MSYDNAQIPLNLVSRVFGFRSVSSRRTPRTRQVRPSAETVRTTSSGAGKDTCSPPQAVDLFPRTSKHVGSRFDDTVALPINAPQDLERQTSALTLRLRALPDVHELGRRSLQYRASLESALRQVKHARVRLADGSYGLCVSCTEPISLALLSEKPWAPECIYCALDI